MVDDGDRMFYDVNGDNEITAADALGVINAIGRGEGMTDPLVELLISIREYQGDAGASPFDGDLLPNADGVYQLEVGDVVDIEIAYEDLRGFGARLGVFQLIADMNISQSGILAPVLFETQTVVIDQAIENVAFADRPNTSITLSIPNSPPGLEGNPLSHTSTWSAFSQSPQTKFARR